jgi:hypothetical protein
MSIDPALTTRWEMLPDLRPAPSVNPEIARRRAELVQLERDYAEAQRLLEQAESIKEDLARLETYRDRFAAVGNKPLEFPQPTAVYADVQQYPVELEPLLSRETGKQIAKRIQVDVDTAKTELQRLEKEAARLMRAERE